MYYDNGAHDMEYMNSKKCVIKPGVKDSTIFVLIWLKIKMMVNIVFQMKARPHSLIAFPKLNLFKKHTNTLKCTF